MRQSLHEAAILIIAACVLGVAYSFFIKQGFFIKAQAGHSAPASSLEMISLETAKEIFETRNALFVDARHEFDYQAGHIHRAVNVPLKMFDEYGSRLNKISKDKLVVVYCDGAECNSSAELAVKLTEAGFTNVKIFFGGWQEWKSANLPIDK